MQINPFAKKVYNEISYKFQIKWLLVIEKESPSSNL